MEQLEVMEVALLSLNSVIVLLIAVVACLQEERDIYDMAVNDAVGGGGAGGSISIGPPGYTGLGLTCNVRGGGGGSVNDLAGSFGPGVGGSKWWWCSVDQR